MDSAYLSRLAATDLTRDRGGCGSTLQRGETTYAFGVGSGPSGRIFCYVDEADNLAYLSWTSNRLSVLADAARTDGDWRTLITW
jgi:hypothetical protein